MAHTSLRTLPKKKKEQKNRHDGKTAPIIFFFSRDFCFSSTDFKGPIPSSVTAMTNLKLLYCLQNSCSIVSAFIFVG
ncbi:hypothetical protein AAZX31_08G345200 [Glycine max]